VTKRAHQLSRPVVRRQAPKLLRQDLDTHPVASTAAANSERGKAPQPGRSRPEAALERCVVVRRHRAVVQVHEADLLAA
jgi:hypothetical protein